MVLISVVQAQSSPDVRWALAATGPPTNARGNGIVVDGTGAIFVTGRFSGTATFGSTSLTGSGSIDDDVFVTRLDNTGNVAWAIKTGKTTLWPKIALDGNGGVLVSNGAGAGVTRIDSSGNIVWDTGLIFTPTDIASDDAGGAIVCGHNSTGAFVMSISNTGGIAWAMKVESESGSLVLAYGIASDGAGGALVTGSFSGTASFGGSISLSASGGLASDVYVMRVNSAGSALWAMKAGGSSGDYANGITPDGSGGAVVTGSVGGGGVFGSTTFTSGGLFVMRVNNAGSVVWATKGGTNSNQAGGEAVVADSSGGVVVTGYFQGTQTFGSIALTTNGHDGVSNSYYDILVMGLDSSGNILWANKFGSSQGSGFSSEEGLDIAHDGSSGYFVTGMFVGTATFGSTTLTTAAPSGTTAENVFVTHLAFPFPPPSPPPSPPPPSPPPPSSPSPPPPSPPLPPSPPPTPLPPPPLPANPQLVIMTGKPTTPPFPPSPAPPGASYTPSLTCQFRMSGDLASFDKIGFEVGIRTQFPLASSVAVTYSAASVVANVRMSFAEMTAASAATKVLASTDVATMAREWFGGAVTILNNPGATVSVQTEITVRSFEFHPSQITAAVATTVYINATVSNGDSVVFLPAGTQDCTGAFAFRQSQGSTVHNAAIRVTLQSIGAYKVCHAKAGSINSDADYGYISSALMIVVPSPDPNLVVDVPTALGIGSGVVLAGALLVLFFAKTGKTKQLEKNINAKDEPRKLLVVEVSDAVADVLIFIGSLTSGALRFANDSSSIVLIVLALLSALSICAVVLEMTLFVFKPEAFILHAHIVLIVSILIEDLFQLTLYVLIGISLGVEHKGLPPIAIGVGKSSVAMVAKLAKVFACTRVSKRVSALANVNQEENKHADSIADKVAAAADKKKAADKRKNADKVKSRGSNMATSL